METQEPSPASVPVQGADGDTFKELSNKHPKELVEDAKEFARQKPGQTILISAAIGLIVGLILKSGRRS